MQKKSMQPYVPHEVSHIYCLALQRTSSLLPSIEQHCLLELYAVMEMFYICTFQCGSHQPHLAVQHLKCG